MKQTHPLYPIYNWLGLIAAYLFAALVVMPLIVIFVLYGLVEILITGKWSKTNDRSKAMGKWIERSLLNVRNLGGTLPIVSPEN